MQSPLRIVIVGAGPAGYTAALYASAHGCQVTVIEAEGLGGTCLQRGCIPTKTLVSATSLLEKIKQASFHGIHIQGEVMVHWTDLTKRISNVVETVTKGVRALFEDRRVELIKGYARLADSSSVEVAGHGRISGDCLLICTGSQPARPSLFLFDSSRIVTSDELLKWWGDLPGSVAIVGEGIVACEFAFILDSLGVKVTVVGMEERPLPTLDGDIVSVLTREMRKRGIAFIGKKKVEALDPLDDRIAVIAEGREIASAERALVCVGRVPRSAGIGAEAIGLRTGSRGEIMVDPFMRTNLPRVYAAGDVTGRTMLAHAAAAQGRLAVAHMLGHPVSAIAEATVPWAIFTAPEIGCVGLTEQAARAKGIAVSCGKFDLRGLGKAHALGELAGMVKIVAEAETGRVLGVHIIGAHAAEMIHEAVLALRQGASVEDLLDTIHAHPTLSEAMSEAAEDVFGQATHKFLKSEARKKHELPA